MDQQLHAVAIVMMARRRGVQGRFRRCGPRRGRRERGDGGGGGGGQQTAAAAVWPPVCAGGDGAGCLARLGVGEDHKGEKANGDADGAGVADGDAEEDGRADNGKDPTGAVQRGVVDDGDAGQEEGRRQAASVLT